MISKAKKILIVDDSNTNIILLEAILGNRGYEIIKTSSVREAIPYLEHSLPDLILLDLLMPKVSGYKFLEDIRKNKHTKNVPVMIVTAVTEKESKIKTQNLGIIDYIEKPINIQELITKVEKALCN
jgi:DNA-binding response OmpR family regulator